LNWIWNFLQTNPGIFQTNFVKYLKLYIFLIILLGGGAGSWFWNTSHAVPQESRLSAEVAIKKTSGKNKDRYMLIDVRESWENQAVRIPGSKHIPLQEIADNIKNIDKKQKLILYCTVGVRSDKAYRVFRKLGFEEVYVLNGGIDAWMEERGPLETPSIPQWIEGKGCES